METLFKAFLSFTRILLILGLGILVINATSNSCADLSFENFHEIEIQSNFEIDRQFNFAEFLSSNQDYKNIAFSEFFKIENSEEEEHVSKSKHYTLDTNFFSISRCVILNGLSQNLQDDIHRYKHSIFRSSTRLHLKFQVFII